MCEFIFVVLNKQQHSQHTNLRMKFIYFMPCHFNLKGEVRWVLKNKTTQTTFFSQHFVFVGRLPVLHAKSCTREGACGISQTSAFGNHISLRHSNILLWLFRGRQCLCCDNFDLDSSPLMPPSERDLQLYTITQLVQLLISVGYELARRFRVALPGEPAQDETHSFHCHEPCNWCTATCIRPCTTHRRHQCARHLGF